MSITPKDPALVAAGHRGAQKRWGPPRIIRLDDLPPEQRAFLVELVAVARKYAVDRPAEAA